MEELRSLYGRDLSTDKVAQSVKVLINSTKLNYVKPDVEAVGGVSNGKICPLCGERRSESANMHVIWRCSEVERDPAMKWLHCSDFRRNLKFLEGLQLRIDEL